jgi:hypothetical protein
MTLGDIDQVFVRGKVDEADIACADGLRPPASGRDLPGDKVFNGRVTDLADGR